MRRFSFSAAFAMVAAVGLVAPSAACNKEQLETYTTRADLERIQVIRTAPDGKTPILIDVEFSYEDCPGEQRKMIRGGKDFAACVQKYKRGEKVPIVEIWGYEAEGRKESKVTQVGDCPRPPDPEDEASFEVVQVCEGIKVHGVRVGFRCDYTPGPELLDVCPWFRNK